LTIDNHEHLYEATATVRFLGEIGTDVLDAVQDAKPMRLVVCARPPTGGDHVVMVSTEKENIVKPYLYVIWEKPTEKQRKEGVRGKVLVPLGVVIADTDEQAKLLVSREITDEHAERIDRIEVAVRPF